MVPRMGSARRLRSSVWYRMPERHAVASWTKRPICGIGTALTGPSLIASTSKL